MYRHNPHTIQSAFSCVTTASEAQAMGQCVGLRKAAFRSEQAPPSLTSQGEAGCSALGLHTGWAPLSTSQPHKRFVLVHGFGIGPLTRSKHHPERSLLLRDCSQILIYCVLFTGVFTTGQRRAAVFCSLMGTSSSQLFSLRCPVD